MGNLLFRLLRIYLKVVWFILGVVPGHVLILVHSKVLSARGRPQSALFPIIFYRVVGFVLTALCISFVNGITTRSVS